MASDARRPLGELRGKPRQCSRNEAPVLVRAAWLTALALLLDAVAAEGDLLRSRRGANSLKSAGQLEHGGLPSEA